MSELATYENKFAHLHYDRPVSPIQNPPFQHFVVSPSARSASSVVFSPSPNFSFQDFRFSAFSQRPPPNPSTGA